MIELSDPFPGSRFLDRCRAIGRRIAAVPDDFAVGGPRITLLPSDLSRGSATIRKGTAERIQVDIPCDVRPQPLAPAFFFILAVLARSPELWPEGPDWRVTHKIALAMDPRLDDELQDKDRAALALNMKFD